MVHLAAAADASRTFAEIDVPSWAWVALGIAIAVLLLVDLLLVHKTAHVITFREAAIESAVWIAVAIGFGILVLNVFGGQAGGEYFAGYLIEKSLSIDNVFVWAVIFTYFGVPAQYRFRVLFWGVFGALVLRAAFIFAGVALVEAFDWTLYVFGAFLVLTAIKVARHSGTEGVHPEQNPVFKLVRRLVPSTTEYDGHKLFTRKTGVRLATPLFGVLVLVEATDVMFAIDSVPAILAISHEPFIVFSSNAFAILGLRALYFLLAGMADKFRFLHVGLGGILAFVGVKMLVAEIWHAPTWLSLSVIAGILTVAIAASIRWPAPPEPPTEPLIEPSTKPDAPASEDQPTTS